MGYERTQNLGKVVFLSLVLMFYFSAVNSGLGIISQIFDQRKYKNLGNISVFTIFLFSALNNFLAPTYIQKYTFICLFFISSLGYIVFLSEGILVCSCEDEYTYGFCRKYLLYPLVVIGSAIAGFLASILFISQNQFISEIKHKNNKALFFGISWAIIQFSYVLGNLYSALIIQPYGQFAYFCIITSISFLSALFLLCVRDPEKKLLASRPSEIFRDNPENFSRMRMSQKIQSLSRMLTSKKIRGYYLFMVQSGIIVSFEFGVLYQLVMDSVQSKDQKLINKKTFIVNILLGVSEFVGGICIGPFGEYFGKINASYVSNIIFQCAIVLSFMSHYLKDYTICLFTGALWGMADCSCQSLNCSMLSEQFGDDIRVFGIYNFIQCLAAFVGMVFSIFCKDLDICYYLCLLIVVQIIVNFSLDKLRKKCIEAEQAANLTIN